MDAVLTTCPAPPCASILGTNARIPWMTLHRSTPRTHRQSSTVSAQARALFTTPALLHSRWTAPNRAKDSSERRSTSPPSDTSATTAWTSEPASIKVLATSSSPVGSMSDTTTRMPSAANRSAIARPSPLAAPVTTATRPGRSSTRTVQDPVDDVVAGADPPDIAVGEAAVAVDSVGTPPVEGADAILDAPLALPAFEPVDVAQPGPHVRRMAV